MQARVANDKLVFGAVSTDHLLEIDWTATAGYEKPTITPYHKLEIDPAASVLHYGLEVRQDL
jgi:branched-chain amino acid aminotransferase